MRGRTRGPILVPSEVYEMTGYVPNVIFPSGHILDKDILTIYYGAADTTVCAAQVYFKDLLETVYEGTAPDRMFKRYSGNPIIVPSDEAVVAGNLLQLLIRLLFIWEIKFIFSTGLCQKITLLISAMLPALMVLI